MRVKVCLATRQTGRRPMIYLTSVNSEGLDSEAKINIRPFISGWESEARSHALRHPDAQQPHAGTYHFGSYIAQSQAQRLHCLILLLENRIVMIELVILLHQFIHIICNNRRRIAASGLFDCRGEIGTWKCKLVLISSEEWLKEKASCLQECCCSAGSGTICQP